MRSFVTPLKDAAGGVFSGTLGGFCQAPLRRFREQYARVRTRGGVWRGLSVPKGWHDIGGVFRHLHPRGFLIASTREQLAHALGEELQETVYHVW